MFRKETRPKGARERVPASARIAMADGSLSMVGAGMVVTGDIVTDGIVRIEGEVRGTVRAAKTVILGQSGRVDGDIFTEDAVIGGTVTGTIVAAKSLELQSTAAVFGEIKAKPRHLKLEEGARFAGEVKLLDAENPAGVLGIDAASEEEHRVGVDASDAALDRHSNEERAGARVA